MCPRQPRAAVTAPLCEACGWSASAPGTPQMPRWTAQGILLAALLCGWAAGAHGRRLAQAPAASLPDNITSGVSWITPERYPAPSSQWRLVQDAGEVLWGPPSIIPQRIMVEEAFLAATRADLDPIGITNRWTNFTAHPSQTPGLENYTAISQHLVEFVNSPELVVTLNAQSTAVLTTQTLAVVHSLGVPSNVDIILQYGRTLHTYAPTGNQSFLNVTTVDVADIKSRVRLRGYDLVPFFFDKQVLLMETLLGIWRADAIPVALLNFSDWQAAEAAVSNPPRGADGIDTIQVDIWTSLLPPENYTAPTVWQDVEAPDGRVYARTGQFGLALNVTLLNATTYLRPKGQMYAQIKEYSAAGGTMAAESAAAPGHSETIAATPNNSAQSSSASLSAGAIAGIAVGAAALAALLVAALYALSKRQRQSSISKPLRSSSVGMSSDGSSASPSELSSEHAGEMSRSEFAICKTTDGKDWVLGEGSFGTLYRALRHGTSEVAVKHIPCLADDPQRLRHLMQREIAIMKRISYDRNIVQFYGACSADDGAWVCMELMEGGDLRKALGRDALEGTREFDWRERGQEVALSVAQGLHFLHQNGVIHRDVKTSNILLTKGGAAKVADVGLATMTDAFSSASNAHGTFLYAAPEVLMGKPSTAKVDSFSYGVVLWEIATKEHSQRGNWRPVRVPQECPAEVEALIRDCITDEPDQRPSMKEIVQRLLAVRDSGPDGAEKLKPPQIIRADPPMETADSVNSLHGQPQSRATPLAT